MFSPHLFCKQSISMFLVLLKLNKELKTKSIKSTTNRFVVLSLINDLYRIGMLFAHGLKRALHLVYFFSNECTWIKHMVRRMKNKDNWLHYCNYIKIFLKNFFKLKNYKVKKYLKKKDFVMKIVSINTHICKFM